MKSLARFTASAAVCLGACSAPRTKLPPELGDCVPPPDAECTSPAFNGSGMPSNPDSGLGGRDGATAAVGCGGADLLVITMNGYCLPCITSTLCCQADQLCGPKCQSLLQCTQKCAQGDQLCVGACENDPLLQAGVTAYLDFAACLSTNCSACPTIQHQ